MVVACAAFIAAIAFWRIHRNAPVSALMERLPEEDSVIFYIDVKALRASGLLEFLAGTGESEESEYREFVQQSGFDYVTDLDAALVSVCESDRFFLLDGRFDWGRLTRYVDSHGGSCHNGFCRVRGSVPGRDISFFAVTPSIMGLASSRDSWAATALERKYRHVSDAEIPAEPFWLTMPGPVLSHAQWLPASARFFAAAMAKVSRVILTLGPSGSEFEARLAVDCPGAGQAAQLARELTRVTDLLQSLSGRDNEPPDSNELGTVLAAGSFERQDGRVLGRWPITKSFLETLAGTNQ